MVMTPSINIYYPPVILEELVKQGYEAMPKKAKKKAAGEDEDNDEEEEVAVFFLLSFHRLLSLNIP